MKETFPECPSRWKLGFKASPNLDWKFARNEADPIGFCIAVKRFSERHRLVGKFDLLYRTTRNGISGSADGDTATSL